MNISIFFKCFLICFSKLLFNFNSHCVFYILLFIIYSRVSLFCGYFSARFLIFISIGIASSKFYCTPLILHLFSHFLHIFLARFPRSSTNVTFLLFFPRFTYFRISITFQNISHILRSNGHRVSYISLRTTYSQVFLFFEYFPDRFILIFMNTAFSRISLHATCSQV